MTYVPFTHSVILILPPKARVASSPIYNTGGRNALFSGRGGLAGRIAPRRYKSPSRTSAPLPSIPDDVEEK